jgi:hypothetical protein
MKVGELVLSRTSYFSYENKQHISSSIVFSFCMIRKCNYVTDTFYIVSYSLHMYCSLRLISAPEMLFPVSTNRCPICQHQISTLARRKQNYTEAIL